MERIYFSTSWEMGLKMAALNCSKWLKAAAILGASTLIATGCGGGGPTDPAPSAAQDATPPRITAIQGIKDGDVVLTSVVLGATAEDDVGVANFKLLVNDTVAVDAALAHIVYSWDVRGTEPGAYVLSFVASDAAGNAATQKVNVTVGGNSGEPQPLPSGQGTPEDEGAVEPAPDGGSPPSTEDNGNQPQVPVTEIETTPVEGTGFILPTMDPELFNPNDSQPPKLIITGVANNSIVWGTRLISIVASDDTGVNVITLLIDDFQLALKEAVGLDYRWDTTIYSDGSHTVTVVVRDNGGKVCRCDLNVTVDNVSDHVGPVIDATSDSSWNYRELSGPLMDVHTNHYGWGCNALGLVHLRMSASDPQGVVELQAEVVGGDSYQVQSGYLEFDLQTDLSSTCYETVKITSKDSLGNSSSCQLAIDCHNICEVEGEVLTDNGHVVRDAVVKLYAGIIESPDQLDGLTPVKSGKTISSGKFNFYGKIPSGLYTLYAQLGRYETLVPLELLSSWRHILTRDEAIVLHGKYGEAVKNERLAIVTGSLDDVPAAFEIMFTTDFNYNTDSRPDWHQMPESISLIDGDRSLSGDEPDFLQFILDPEQSYQYHYMIIESGNAYEDTWLANPEAVDALRGWVEDGGQLVVTGQAYDFVEQMFPEAHDFAGDVEIDGEGPIPELHNAAQAGHSTVYVEPNEQLYCDYVSLKLPKLLSSRGLEIIPLILMPDGWPLVLSASHQSETYCWLRSAEPLPNMIDSLPLITGHRAELGRVRLICFPIAQADTDASHMAALILDVVCFDPR